MFVCVCVREVIFVFTRPLQSTLGKQLIETSERQEEKRGPSASNSAGGRYRTGWELDGGGELGSPTHHPPSKKEQPGYGVCVLSGGGGGGGGKRGGGRHLFPGRVRKE